MMPGKSLTEMPDKASSEKCITALEYCIIVLDHSLDRVNAVTPPKIKTDDSTRIFDGLTLAYDQHRAIKMKFWITTMEREREFNKHAP